MENATDAINVQKAADGAKSIPVPAKKKGRKAEKFVLKQGSLEDVGKTLDGLQPLKIINSTVSRSGEKTTTYYTCTWKECDARVGVVQCPHERYDVKICKPHKHGVEIKKTRCLHPAIRAIVEELKEEGVTVDDVIEKVAARLKEPAAGEAALGPYVTQAKSGYLQEKSFVLQVRKHYAGQNEDSVGLVSRAKKVVHSGSDNGFQRLFSGLFRSQGEVSPMPVLGEMLQCASLPDLLDTVKAKMTQLKTPAKHRRFDGHLKFDTGFCSFIGILIAEIAMSCTPSRGYSLGQERLHVLYGVAEASHGHLMNLLSCSDEFMMCVRSEEQQGTEETLEQLVALLDANQLQEHLFRFFSCKLNIEEPLWHIKLKQAKAWKSYSNTSVRYKSVSHFVQSGDVFCPRDRRVLADSS